MKKLCERNNDSICFETFKIEFDDITIVLEGVEGYPILLVEQVINQLPEALTELKRQGVDQVYSIKLPFYKTDDDNQPFHSWKEREDDPIWWRIHHDTNEVSYYCPTTKEYQ
ncbi:MAG: hypothetical protein K2M12_10775 [Muribaculaceae bacterium]|nr:hypothetical protein [Muribaculaceae bacterium]